MRAKSSARCTPYLPSFLSPRKSNIPSIGATRLVAAARNHLPPESSNIGTELLSLLLFLLLRLGLIDDVVTLVAGVERIDRTREDLTIEPVLRIRGKLEIVVRNTFGNHIDGGDDGDIIFDGFDR